MTSPHPETALAPRIELRGIAAAYGVEGALSGISLSVAPGEVTAIVGEHSSGKSTLAAVMCGAIAPTAGEILIDGVGRPCLEITQARSLGIQMVHQQNLLFERATVAESIVVYGDGGRPGTIVRARRIAREAERYLAEVGIAIDPSKTIRELGVSERALVDILVRIHRKPRLLVLDEALEKLSAEAFAKVEPLLRSLQAEGSSIVLVTPHIDYVRPLADSVCILKGGRLLMSGKVDAIDRISILKMAYTQIGLQESARSGGDDYYDLLKYNEAILLELPEAVVVVDERGILRFANKSARAVFSADRKSSLPASIADFFGPRGAAIERIIAEAGAGRETRTFYGVTFGADEGPDFADVTASPIFDGAFKMGILLVIMDTTEKESLRQRLELTEKLASVGLLAAGVAHEINNPLEIIKNNVNLIKLRGRDGETIALVDELVDELKSISRITENLIVFSEDSGGEDEVFDLDGRVRSLVRLIKKDADERRISLEFERTDSEPVYVRASSGGIRQVLLNLYKNSCEAMPDGGRIAISLDPRASGAEGFSRLEFADSGYGLPQGRDGDIFMPFYSTKRTGKNQGLGLWMTYNIVKKFGGAIRAEKVEPKGCRFAIDIPLA